MVLGLIQEIKEKHPNCAKPNRDNGCKSLIIMGNGIDLIDYNSLWSLLADCSMLENVCFHSILVVIISI